MLQIDDVESLVNMLILITFDIILTTIENANTLMLKYKYKNQASVLTNLRHVHDHMGLFSA